MGRRAGGTNKPKGVADTEGGGGDSVGASVGAGVVGGGGGGASNRGKHVVTKKSEAGVSLGNLGFRLDTIIAQAGGAALGLCPGRGSNHGKSQGGSGCRVYVTTRSESSRSVYPSQSLPRRVTPLLSCPKSYLRGWL